MVAARDQMGRPASQIHTPSGLAISGTRYPRLFVSDATTNEIIAFRIRPPGSPFFGANRLSGTKLVELRRVTTPATQIMGLAFDAVTSRLFYVDKMRHEVSARLQSFPSRGCLPVRV